jgi:recombination protein RecT
MGNQSAAMVTGSKEAFANLRDLFTRQKGAIAALLPKHLPPDKVIKLVLSAASRTPDLLECDANSILLAAMQSAALGLEPNTPLQQAYLVPYWNKKTGRKEAQFIPGYRGLITLAIQSGEIRSVQARAIYEKDSYSVRYGLDETIEHTPFLGGDRGPLVAVYSVAVFANGAKTFDFMTRDEVERIKAASKAKVGPWVDHFDEMAKKTVIRRHSKVMPLSPEKSEKFVRALVHQGRAEANDAPDYGDVIDAAPQLAGENVRTLPTRTEQLEQQLAGNVEASGGPVSDEDMAARIERGEA